MEHHCICLDSIVGYTLTLCITTFGCTASNQSESDIYPGHGLKIHSTLVTHHQWHHTVHWTCCHMPVPIQFRFGPWMTHNHLHVTQYACVASDCVSFHSIYIFQSFRVCSILTSHYISNSHLANKAIYSWLSAFCG